MKNDKLSTSAADPDPYVFGSPGSGLLVGETNPDPSNVMDPQHCFLNYGYNY